jgi:hypothetical protein
MLALRPNCELCDKDLPFNSEDARICSYECTFCATCVEEELLNVCPNCAGGFVPRPIRPSVARRPGVGLEHQPAQTERVVTKMDRGDIDAFTDSIKGIPPGER